MKFFTIENSEGVFTLNINYIKSLNKSNSKQYQVFGGPNCGDVHHQPETYSIDTNDNHYMISKKEYLQIMKMIVDNE